MSADLKQEMMNALQTVANGWPGQSFDRAFVYSHRGELADAALKVMADALSHQREEFARLTRERDEALDIATQWRDVAQNAAAEAAEAWAAAIEAAATKIEAEVARLQAAHRRALDDPENEQENGENVPAAILSRAAAEAKGILGSVRALATPERAADARAP